MTTRLAPARPRPWSRWALVLLGLTPSVTAHAQTRAPSTRSVISADSAFAAGDIERAESLYYIGVRERPRDPIVREALGRYLAARGATKVAIVLLEEARMFGGDPTRIATHLAPLYQHLGDWRALLTLPSSPLAGAERQRAAWLAEHPFGSKSDSASMLNLDVPKADTVARLAVRIAGRRGFAIVVGSDAGVVIGRSIGAGVRRFGGDSVNVVLDSLVIGSLKLVNVPATVGRTSADLIIGIAAFNRLMPTLDYGRNRVSFARSDFGAAESRFLLVRDGGQLRVLENGRWKTLGEFAAAIARARKVMTVDVKAGEVRVRR